LEAEVGLAGRELQLGRSGPMSIVVLRIVRPRELGFEPAQLDRLHPLRSRMVLAALSAQLDRAREIDRKELQVDTRRVAPAQRVADLRAGQERARNADVHLRAQDALDRFLRGVEEGAVAL